MYKSLRDCINDLENQGQLLRIKEEVSGHLEMAAIHRQVFAKRGPAILFENIKDSPFQAVSNIYGTKERIDYLFNDSLGQMKKLIDIKLDPTLAFSKPFNTISTLPSALHSIPKKIRITPDIANHKTSIEKLPQIVSWPDDGGAFMTCPQVFSLPPNDNKILNSNLGMYRIQMSGNDYITNEEIGLHYQLHRGIGIHHTSYNETEEEFKVTIFVGGPPSHAFAAVMPLPEGMSELTFAGILNKRRFRYYIDEDGFVLSADADFCITGVIDKKNLKPEGPFGDHLGYYSLTHDFPVMRVKNVYHKKDPIWHFTVVSRPPAEDSYFGYLIHKLVNKLTPNEFPGVKEIHAVDVAGVHPLLLAIGEERYMPFREKRPEEILTIANRIIGSGQTSLAKYLLIIDGSDNPAIKCDNHEQFFSHILERIDWRRDLHFQTNTSIDTLDYSGDGWNTGSKLIMACSGDIIRKLGDSLVDAKALKRYKPMVVSDGILIIESKFTDDKAISNIKEILSDMDLISFPLVVIVDDSGFASNSFDNFLWVCFTRSNPASDIYGIDSFTKNKHWGCNGSLIIDARIKPHHAPPLIPDAAIEERAKKILERYQ